MQNLGAAMRLLDQKDPALSARIQPIFVTVDPVRDTPAVLREFTDAFYPRLLGLTGDPATIAKVAKEYAVYFKAHPSGPGGGYLVDHTRSEEHTSELQSLMRISYAVLCLQKK